MLAEHDAALIVGDAALESRRLGGVETVDLGAAWREHAGLPMVYAVWASRKDPARYGFWADRVSVTVGWAERHLDEVVAEALRRGAPATDEDLRVYFSSAISYRVGLREGAEEVSLRGRALVLRPLRDGQRVTGAGRCEA